MDFLVLEIFRPTTNSLKISGPLYTARKKNCPLFKVHYALNDRLDLTVSMLKLILKNKHQIPRYYTNVSKFKIRGIFFKTNVCVETIRSSRSF